MEIIATDAWLVSILFRVKIKVRHIFVAKVYQQLGLYFFGWPVTFLQHKTQVSGFFRERCCVYVFTGL